MQPALLEALEPRILYSADLAAVLGAASGAVGLQQSLQHSLQPSLQPSLQAPLHTTQAAAAETTAPLHELAFVDLALPDAQSLLAGLAAQRDAGRSLHIFSFAADEDGLAVISQTLQQQQALGQPVHAVHLFSHGSAGQVHLGGFTLSHETALQRAPELAHWGSALGAEADLLIYGCDVANLEAGAELLRTLAALTGADVAASSDATGSAQRGGNWVLESSSGAIETTLAVGAELQQNWGGLLGTEFRVNSTTGDDQTTDALTRGSQQAVALDAAGNFVVVWSSRDQDTDGYGVYARRFAWNGTPLSAEIQVSTTTAGDQNQARVVSDAAGNFVVVWSSNTGASAGGGIFMRRFSGNGNALTAEIGVNSFINGDQVNPVVAMNRSSGEFVVAWQGAGSTDAAGISFRRYSATASALDTADVQANTINSGNEANPAVAMDNTGRFVIAYDVGNHLYFQRFDATGGPQGARTQVDNLLSNSSGAAVAMDAAGNFTLVYRDGGLLAAGVWGRGYLADGSPRTNGFQVDNGDATSPSIAIAADGAFVVTYQKTGTDGNDIYARPYAAAGTADGAAFAVNAYTVGEQASSSVAALSAGNFVVVWSGRNTGDAAGVAGRSFEDPAAAPVITSDGGGATAARRVAENSTAVTTVTATDSNGSTSTFSLAGGADAARFSIHPTTGMLVFVNAPDFETPADSDANNTYEVVVRASDGALTDDQTITVTVTDVGSPLTVTTTADVLDGNTASVEALVLNPGADGLISLREAISAANNTTGPATIVLGAGSYLLGIAPVGASDDNADGDFDITATLTITGAGASATEINGQALHRVLDLRGSANVTLNDLSVRGGLLANNAYGAGAHLDPGASLTLSGVVMTAHQAGTGGAIYNHQGTLLATDSTISNNAAVNWGGGIYNDRGSVTLLRSTLSGNSAGNDGGAINNAGAGSSLTLVNTTLSGNSATGLGGAVFTNRPLTALNSTIAFNTSGSGAAGIHLLGAGSAQLQNTLLYNPAGANTSNAVVSLGHNFDSDGSAALAGSGDLSGATGAPIDPRLGALLNNGGATATHALLAGSAALDAGNTAAAPATDQRGLARWGAADIGAYEAPSAINRLPQNQVPSSLAVLEDALTAVPGLSVSDEDETTGLAQNRLGTSALSVLNGRLVVTLAGGATISTGANGSLALTLTGSQAALNATLATLSYQANANYVGSDTLTVFTTDDNGQSDTDSLPITVAAVNDAPNGSSATLTLAAGSALTLSSAHFGFADSSAEGHGFAAVRVQLPSAGTVVLNGTTLSAAAEISLAQLNAGLLRFVPAPGASGSGYATLTFQVRDNGGTANGGVDLDPTPATLTFNIANRAPQIDGPVGTASASLTQAEGRLAVATIAATDPDSADTVSYRIAGGADAARFVIDGGSGALRFAAAPDFENPLDAGANNVYEVRVQASDGLLDDTLSLTVQVSDIGNRIVVTTTADVADGDLSSIEALTNNPGADGEVSLREALTAANNSAGIDTVAFSISAPLVAGAHTLQLSSALPALTSPVLIDGRSEADFSATPVLQLLGQGLWSTGLRLAAGSDGSTVQALALSGFTGDAVQVQGSQGHRLLGNHIGTDVTGRLLLGNGGAGIAADGPYLVIGGVSAGDGNVIAGSGSAAISLDGGAANSAISGNLIGIGRGGEALGNVWGIDLGAGVHDVRIGGTAAGAGNVIAYSSQNAIRLAPSAGNGNHWQGNTLRDNSGLAIDLGGDGVTGNDSGDVDSGPNRLQNHPVLATATVNGAGTVVAGALDSNANTRYRIEFYAAASAHASGYGIGFGNASAPGSTWLGAATITTDAAGHADFSVALPAVETTPGHVISALVVVDLGGGNFGDASEFGPAQTVSAENFAPQIVSDGAGSRAAVAVAENATAVTTVQALDSDLPPQVLAFSIVGGADASRFTLHPGTGALAFVAAPDFEAPSDSNADGVYAVQVQVSDGALVDTQLISVTVTDRNEFAVSAPRDVDARPNRVTESAAVGTTVGLRLAAQDQDGSNHDVSYRLADDADGRFAIDARSGVVSLARALGEAGLAGHTLTVQARSTDGSFSTQTFAVNVVLENNHAPVITSLAGAAAAVVQVQEGQVTVGTVTATDADLPAQPLLFSLAGGADAADAALFSINSSSGLLSFLTAPNFEQPLDANGDGHYELVLAVHDGLATVLQPLTVSVGNVNEPPALTSQTLLLAGRNATLDLQATDPESPSALLRYEVVRADGGHFEWQLDAPTGGAPAGTVASRFTQADVDAQRVRFVLDAGASPSFQLALSDGAHRVLLGAPRVVRVAEAPASPGAGAVAAPAEASSLPLAVAATTRPAAPAGEAATARAAPEPAPQSAAPEALTAPVLGAANSPISTPQETAPTRNAAAVPAAATKPPPNPSDASAFWNQALATLALPDADAPLLRDTGVADFSSSRNISAWSAAMDEARVPGDDGLSAIELGTAGTVLVSSGFSVGYVLWLARGGALVASLMSSVPAWASVDPLPVLSQMRQRGAGKGKSDVDDGVEDDDFDPIERLFSHARRLLPGAGPEAELQPAANTGPRAAATVAPHATTPARLPTPAHPVSQLTPQEATL